MTVVYLFLSSLTMPSLRRWKRRSQLKKRWGKQKKRSVSIHKLFNFCVLMFYGLDL